MYRARPSCACASLLSQHVLHSRATRRDHASCDINTNLSRGIDYFEALVSNIPHSRAHLRQLRRMTIPAASSAQEASQTLQRPDRPLRRSLCGLQGCIAHSPAANSVTMKRTPCKLRGIDAPHIRLLAARHVLGRAHGTHQ
ncbi:hypothetical protein PsYK624_078450 [Phanerochaete sordida]|uniref:Uncharacterized protein n=1 Tax=Phanerochaete sordida TaxID=48140 RepID=A0A9P3GD82_9APHY|nr:hypothetical protein PsYK624_078450 [Phanerochaete sordida]